MAAYNTSKRDREGRVFHPREAGWVGFDLNVRGERLYHSGDTDVIPEMDSVVGVDVALLPVSGTYVMTAEEAAEAARRIQPRRGGADALGRAHRHARGRRGVRGEGAGGGADPREGWLAGRSMVAGVALAPQPPGGLGRRPTAAARGVWPVAVPLPSDQPVALVVVRLQGCAGYQRAERTLRAKPRFRRGPGAEHRRTGRPYLAAGAATASS